MPKGVPTDPEVVQTIIDLANAGMSQTDIAKHCGINVHTVQRYEKRNGIHRRPSSAVAKTFDLSTCEGAEAAYHYHIEGMRRAKKALEATLERDLLKIQQKLDEIRAESPEDEFSLG